jgi:hypothetical protein
MKSLSKTILRFCLILIIIFIFYSFSLLVKKRYPVSKLENNFNVEVAEITPKIVTPTIKLKNVKDYNQFLDDIGFRESSNNYKAVNQFGYLGKYQFGRHILNNLGYKNVSNNKFLSTPPLQDKVMYDLLNHNKRILRRQIKKYNGKLVNGVLITESGILAAAHLAGPGNVKKWFRKGIEFKDGNGTKMTSYLKQFAGYNLYL